jgi:hypothetical protein
MTLAWIAERLHMGVPTHVACLLYREKKNASNAGNNENTDSAEKPPVFEDKRRCTKSVGNSYALIWSIRDLNDRGIHQTWSFSLSLFDPRGFSAESILCSDPATAAREIVTRPSPSGWRMVLPGAGRIRLASGVQRTKLLA